MKYFIGVDIGNSKTHYALADDAGRVKSVYHGKGANYQHLGPQETTTRLQTGLAALMEEAGLAKEDVAFIYYGAAGADSADDFTALRDIFQQITPEIPHDFDNDGWISLKSGTIDGVGMVITCGSGNTNFAMNAQGRRKRVGGLDHVLGDVLGAGMIAFYACRAAARSADGRDYPTVLSRLIPEALGVSTMEATINLPRTAEQHKIVIDALFRAAGMGDGKALDIIWILTKEVADIVRELHAALFQAEARFKLVLDGSVFRAKYQPLMTMIDVALHQRYAVDIIIPEWDPVVGALLYAFDKGGISVTDEMANTLTQTYRTLASL